MTTRHCTQCGQAAEAGVKFCTNCGSPLPVLEAPAPAPAADPAPTAAPVVAAEPVSTAPAIVESVPAQILAPVELGPAPTADDGLVIRRTRTSPFLPPVLEPDDAPVVSRVWAQSQPARSGTGKLSKQRKMAGGLPDWEPLPPGEVLVTRTPRGRK